MWNLAPAQSQWVVVHAQADENLTPGSHPMQLVVSALRTDEAAVNDDIESQDIVPRVRRAVQQRSEKTVFFVPR